MDRRKAAYNSTYKKLAVQWLNGTLCYASSSLLADSSCLRNRQLFVDAKRFDNRNTMNINSRFISTFIIVTFLLGLSSCSTIFSGLYGIKNLKALDEMAIIRYSKKFNIPSSDLYEMDASYFSYLSSLDSIKYLVQLKNHSQPLQSLYFDKTGQLVSFQVNCYAGGFPNLKWDRNKIMTTFPPNQQAPLDSILSFEKQLNYLRPLSQTEKFSIQDYDYFVVVYWNRFMGRQSKRLIRIVQDNGKLLKEKKIKIIYVNSDNLLVGAEKNSSK